MRPSKLLLAPLLLPALSASLAGLPLPGARAEDEDAGGPILEIAEPTYSWGKAFKGQQLEHTFVLKNTGVGPLTIEALKPNCSCMVPPEASTFSKPIPPGGSLALTLRVDTSVLAPGKVGSKHTEVVSNATRGENLLHVEGEIEELFTLEPPFPRIEVIRGHTDIAEFEADLLLAATGGRKVALDSFKSEGGLVSSKVEELAAGARFRVRMTAQPKSRDAFQKDVLATEVTVEGKPIPFVIPVTVLLKDRIDVTPSPSVFFARKVTSGLIEKPGEPIERELEIVSIGGEKHRFQVLKATPGTDGFEARVTPLKPGQSYRLTVALKRGPAEGERILKDTIEVATDDPEVPTISIRVSAQF